MQENPSAARRGNLQRSLDYPLVVNPRTPSDRLPVFFHNSNLAYLSRIIIIIVSRPLSPSVTSSLFPTCTGMPDTGLVYRMHGVPVYVPVFTERIPSTKAWPGWVDLAGSYMPRCVTWLIGPIAFRRGMVCLPRNGYPRWVTNPITVITRNKKPGYRRGTARCI